MKIRILNYVQVQHGAYIMIVEHRSGSASRMGPKIRLEAGLRLCAPTLVSHLRCEEKGIKLGFGGGWREVKEVEGERVQWPREGIGSRNREWGKTIHGDSRSFAQVVSAQSSTMADKGDAWRWRDPQPWLYRPQGF